MGLKRLLDRWIATWGGPTKQSGVAAEIATPLERLSDGEFALYLAELFLPDRLASPPFIEHVQAILKEDVSRRPSLVMQMFNDKLAYVAPAASPHDATNAWLMGTPQVVTPAIWERRRCACAAPRSKPPGRPKRTIGDDPHLVTAIASMYKANRYIESFLENIVGQTLFEQTELLIVDAASPDGEEACIRRYMERYPDNITYIKLNYRIGVYEAWNLAARLARGRFLTNTNMDDLRRDDSFELQADALLTFDDIDVVYQDYLLTFDRDLRVDEIEALNFRSDLPLVTPYSLMEFNSPHNAPMWKKAVHDDVGYFDTNFKSSADWEFWLRCLAHDKTFHKLNDAHAIYYRNMEGVSTRPDTEGFAELPRIARAYARKLYSRHLVSSRKEFAANLALPGLADVDAASFDRNSRLDLVHDRLIAYSKVAHPRYAPARAADPDAARSRLRIVVDGVIFQLKIAQGAGIWTPLMALLAQTDAYDICLLDRGNAPRIHGVTTTPFPTYTFTNVAADSLLLQQFCTKFAADVFISTTYTTPTSTPSVSMLHDAQDGSDVSDHLAWREKQLAAAHAYGFVRLSAPTDANATTASDASPGTLVKALKTAIAEAVDLRRASLDQPFATAWQRLRSIQADVDWKQTLGSFDQETVRQEAIASTTDARESSAV